MNKVEAIAEALNYVKRFSGKKILIKIGGSLLEDAELVQQLCHDLSLLRAVGLQLILVHGGGKAINQALDQYNIQSEFIDGLRVTTPEAMNVIEMVIAGKVNSMLVRTLNGMGVKAQGISGSDNNLLLCDRWDELHGCVGKIKKINPSHIEEIVQQQLMGSGSIPVIAPIGVTETGEALNINADWAAASLACALGAFKLIYLTDEPGIYDKKGQSLSEVSNEEIEQLIADKVVTGGMLTKVKTIQQALANGFNQIHIISGKEKHGLIQELFTETGIGTICQRGK